ncbi:hypothetical protein AVEN_102925-1, partial [Araneus ventricosus]
MRWKRRVLVTLLYTTTEILSLQGEERLHLLFDMPCTILELVEDKALSVWGLLPPIQHLVFET